MKVQERIMDEKSNDIQEPTEINFKEPIIKFYR